MSTYKTRRRILGSDGVYHTVYEETTSDQVIHSDGQTVAEHIDNGDIHITTAEKTKLSGIPSDAKYTDTTYDVATTDANGLMSSSDKSKLNGIAAGANNYTHPSYTAKSSGFYKVTVDASGHVSAVTAVTKADITGLGIPAQDTTYSAASQSAAGLMSAADKTKLDGIATGANKITVDTALSSTSTNPVQNKVVQAALAGKAASSHGNHVPATETANNAKFLRNDNTWQTVTPANIGAAASSHGTHVTWSTTTPKALGTAAVGSETKVARGDHVHPLPALTSCTGTLTVAKGGTGATTFTSGAALIGAGTSAVTTRTIRNNTATSGAVTADTALITSNTLRYAINRTTSVAAADTNYTTYMARGQSLNSAETTPTVNGTIAWTYE